MTSGFDPHAGLGDEQEPDFEGPLSSMASPFMAQWRGRTGAAHDQNGHWAGTAPAQAEVPESGPSQQTETVAPKSPAPARSAPQQEALDIAALDRARDERLSELYALQRSDPKLYRSKEVQKQIEALEATKHDEVLQRIRSASRQST